MDANATGVGVSATRMHFATYAKKKKKKKKAFILRT